MKTFYDDWLNAGSEIEDAFVTSPALTRYKRRGIAL
jgi:hypothetical protein